MGTRLPISKFLSNKKYTKNENLNKKVEGQKSNFAIYLF